MSTDTVNDDAFDRFASASLEELTKLVGPKAAQSIIDYFSNKDNQLIVLKLKQAGVTMSGSIR